MAGFCDRRLGQAPETVNLTRMGGYRMMGNRESGGIVGVRIGDIWRYVGL